MESNDLLESIRCDYDVPKSELIKLGRDKKYKRFPGLTVVCDLITDLGTWYSELDKVFPHHVWTLLPLSSFHMTIRSLWTLKGFPTLADYNQHNEKHIQDLLRMKKVFDENTVLQFSMKVSPDTSRLDLSPSDPEVELNLKYWGKSVDGKNRPAKTFHLSLFYEHIPNGKPSEEELKAYWKVLETIPKVLEFGPPKLCKFEDMTQFIPV